MTPLPLTTISHLIPQKSPFVMVDTLVAFSEEKITSGFKILDSNLFVKDNLFLEAGLIENMAQTVALHTGYTYFLKGETPPIGYIGSIKKVDVRKLPMLHETITTTASILHEFMGVTLVKITAFNANNEEIASSEMKTVISK
jgi:3-hydroxyacyl-[acyl-carrier-protein] dehydratase